MFMIIEKRIKEFEEIAFTQNDNQVNVQTKKFEYGTRFCCENC